MYTDFFGLNEKPFSITPDPRYLYLTQRHADALAHLIYGISESGGFIQLTGEVGTGKTTLIRSLLEQMPKKARLAVILNPNLNAHEFLQAVCQELNILLPPEQTKSELISALNNYLLRAHAESTRVVLIVDEAQTLDAEVLEQVRLLTNLETTRQKLLQIILIGQPELRDVLQRPDMRQIAQRITGRYHLEPLRRDETQAYVKHRMKVAGAHGEVFSPSAVRELYRRSGGIPRLINVVADRALLAAYSLDRTRIDGPLVRSAATEVFGRPRRRLWLASIFGALAAAAIIGGSFFSMGRVATDEPVEAAATAQLAASDIVAAEFVAESNESTESDATVMVDEAEVGAPETPVTESLADVLSRATGDATTESEAFATLFGLWGIELDRGGETPCDQAALHGLDCLRLTDGSLRQLRQLDRPTIVSLMDQEGAAHYAVLSAIDYDRAELLVAGEPVITSLAELSLTWRGQHTLLWKPVIPGVSNMAIGLRGAGVEWLYNALSAVLSDIPEEAEGISDFYDERLETLVRSYQRQKQLKVDGIAGAQTQIALTTDLHTPGVPTLGGS